jgi:hypothetical protein
MMLSKLLKSAQQWALYKWGTALLLQLYASVSFSASLMNINQQ